MGQVLVALKVDSTSCQGTAMLNESPPPLLLLAAGSAFARRDFGVGRIRDEGMYRVRGRRISRSLRRKVLRFGRLNLRHDLFCPRGLRLRVDLIKRAEG